MLFFIKKKPIQTCLNGLFAEREGFEPSVPLPVRQFSKLFLSASQASLRNHSENVPKDVLFLFLPGCKYNNSTFSSKIYLNLLCVVNPDMIDTHQH